MICFLFFCCLFFTEGLGRRVMEYALESVCLEFAFKPLVPKYGALPLVFLVFDLISPRD
jgi:hypothetical protein